MLAPAAECVNDAYMNLGFQSTLRICAAMCSLKRGTVFSYGAKQKNMCGKGSCACKCWHICTATKKSAVFNLYKIEGDSSPKKGLFY